MAACVGFGPAVVPANELGLSPYSGDEPNTHGGMFVDAYNVRGVRKRLLVGQRISLSIINWNISQRLLYIYAIEWGGCWTLAGKLWKMIEPSLVLCSIHRHWGLQWVWQQPKNVCDSIRRSRTSQHGRLIKIPVENTCIIVRNVWKK